MSLAKALDRPNQRAVIRSNVSIISVSGQQSGRDVTIAFIHRRISQHCPVGRLDTRISPGDTHFGNQFGNGVNKKLAPARWRACVDECVNRELSQRALCLDETNPQSHAPEPTHWRDRCGMPNGQTAGARSREQGRHT